MWRARLGTPPTRALRPSPDRPVGAERRGRLDCPAAGRAPETARIGTFLAIHAQQHKREQVTPNFTREDPRKACRASVLLAEDDDDLRTLLARTLREEGFDVVECSNGLTLAEELVLRLRARDRVVGLVVSDVCMPGVTGISVLQALADWEESPAPPMILITAFGTPRMHELAQRFGAISVLEKPFEVVDLVRVVREAMEGGDPDRARTHP